MGKIFQEYLKLVGGSPQIYRLLNLCQSVGGTVVNNRIKIGEILVEMLYIIFLQWGVLCNFLEQIIYIKIYPIFA